MASTEMSPIARTGGLGDVLESFPAELQKRDHDVTVALPYYRCIRENPKLKIRSTGVQINVQVGGKRLDAEVLETRAPNGVQVFLVRRDEYFDRSGFYGADGRAYDDNAERFIYFQKAVIELARRVSPPPEILHCHDWQTALIPVFAKQRKLPFKTVLTIHNIAHQGSFWGMDFGLTNLPGDYFGPKGVEFYGNMNFLKGGIVCADAITTVSERYARDIQTPEYGAGLDAVLRENKDRLTGILNGADYTQWDPATDKRISKRYSPDSLAGKSKCRDALLRAFKLDKNPKGPVYAMVTRLAEQKGFDVLLPLLDRLLSEDVRLVILGEGDPAYERELRVARKKHKGRFAFETEFTDKSAHLIQAGADVTLIPSKFEPCGLSAMYSLKYGTIPIARDSGGLHQIVQDYDPTTGSGNGFVFFDYSVASFWDAIRRARKLFRSKEEWSTLMRRAMQSDFSWDAAAEKYERLYEFLSESK
jgi:starch synthase